MKRIISIALILIAFYGTSVAQQKVLVSGGADLVSSYIWRGSYNAGASFQPSLSASIAHLCLSTWGSVDFIGQQRKEIDLSLSYKIKGLTIGVTDYWWEGEGAFDYFHYTKGVTSHRWEANFMYEFPITTFPLIISWSTMFSGNDYNAKGERSYSSYIEFIYSFAASKNVNMTASVGATPWNSPSILSSENSGLSVCNIGILAQYAIKCSDKISIPIFTRLVFNPAIEDVHLIFGVSLYFDS